MGELIAFPRVDRARSSAAAAFGDPLSTADVLAFGRALVDSLRDPFGSAARVVRLVDRAPTLCQDVERAAQSLLGNRGEVRDVEHAVMLLGFDRLERVAGAYLQRALARAEVGPSLSPPGTYALRYAAI